jgi:hypothetical protein
VNIDDDTLHNYAATISLNRAARRRLMQRTITCRGCHIVIKAKHATTHFVKCRPAQLAAAAEVIKDPEVAAVIEKMPDPDGR